MVVNTSWRTKTSEGEQRISLSKSQENHTIRQNGQASSGLDVGPMIFGFYFYAVRGGIMTLCFFSVTIHIEIGLFKKKCSTIRFLLFFFSTR